MNTLFSRIITIVAAFLLTGDTLAAQAKEDFCVQSEILEQLYEQDPTRLQKQNELDLQLANQYQNATLSSVPSTYTLPIVVHIIHQGNLGDLSDDAVQTAIAQVNLAFANQAPYDPSTGVPTDIEFCLATRDPEGNNSSGITRTENALTNVEVSSQDLELKNLIRWDPLRYINIWVVNEICSGTNCGVAGYAFLPASHGQPEDGVVIESNFMGSSPANTSILIHELGHYLGLYHTFEGGCTNDNCLLDGDRICDTPPDQSTVRINCGEEMNSCSTDVNATDLNNPFSIDVNDMFNNYMDYSNLSCYSVFTSDQADRMIFFIEGIRNTLMNENRCLPPCPDPVSAAFSVSTNLVVGEVFNLNNSSLNANAYQWFLDDIPFSIQNNPDYVINQPGTYHLKLIASNDNVFCNDAFEVLVTVSCDVASLIEITQFPPYQIDQEINFTHPHSIIADYQWEVNQQSISTNENLNHTFSAEGLYEVCLIVESDLCLDAFCQQIAIQNPSTCFSETDIDGDGLVGCYDPECCESPDCTDNYYNECPIDCEYTPTLTTFELEPEWISSGADWCAYNTPITGDLDRDGIPEIIGKPCTGPNQFTGGAFPNLLVVDGSTGEVEAIINTPAMRYMMDAPAIADVDLDGYPEIFIQASGHVDNQNYLGGSIITGDVRRRILCYGFNGIGYVEKWMSDVPAGYNFLEDGNSISVADFNQDGVAEVYLQNMIFNAITGELIVKGNENDHRGMKTFEGIQSVLLASSFPVAVDVLPNDACSDCAGLELVAGGMVYSVNLSNANPQLTIERTANGGEDGWTSIADIDLDGDLDAVVTGNAADGSTGIIYAWDLQTNDLLYDIFTVTTNSGFIAQVNVADFDGDQELEIGVCTPFNYQVLKPVSNEWTIAWSITTDDWSGQTGSSVFDFNNDGASEVVYRTETEILVLNGINGAELSAAPCASGTRVEYPVVVDVDADGATEILCSCANELKSFGSGGTPWIPTRKLWNQHQYFNTNINDDLRIPIEQQSHHIVGDSLVLNNFLTQYANRQFPAADLTVEGNIECLDQQYYITLTYSNQGNTPIGNNFYTTIRNKNPLTTPGGLVERLTHDFNLGPGDSFSEVIVLPPGMDTIYIVTNDDASLTTPYDFERDFPVSNIYECNYLNNLEILTIEKPNLSLDLGPDQIVCDNGVLVLSAEPGWDEYRWQDGERGSDYTAIGPGTYWVTAIKGCWSETDTVRVIVDESTVVDLGPDIRPCVGDSVQISLSGFETYLWSSSEEIDCPTCPSITLSTQDTQLYQVVVRTESGCYSEDSILVLPSNIDPTHEIVSICSGETLTYEGFEITPGSRHTFSLASEEGCDSLVTIVAEEVFPLSISYDVEDVSCYGEEDGRIQMDESLVDVLFSLDEINFSSTLVFADLPAGDYTIYGQDEFGCVSETFVIVDSPDPLSLLVSPDTSVVLGCPVDLRSYTNAIGTLNYQWFPAEMMDCDTCPTSITNPYFTTDYQLVITDQNGCTAMDATIVTVNKPRPIFIPNAFSPNGDGENDVFMIYSDKEVEEVISFRIYNRWGALVFADESFSPNDPTHGWNGFFKSEKMNPGVFVYVAEVLFLDGVTVQYSGDVSLLL